MWTLTSIGLKKEEDAKIYQFLERNRKKEEN